MPRAIVVGRAYIQHFEEKSLSNYEYRCIVGSKKSHTDRQGELAKDLCAHAGINVEEYNNGSKTFGMEEVKLFARLLAPKYGIAVHNSLTANSKVFETSTTEDQKIASWINLLNLNDHFNPITKPSGFFGTHYWCELCNKCYHDKLNHRCIPNCVACKTLDTENCNFKHGKTTHCNACNRDFYGEACFRNHKTIGGKKKNSVCHSLHCCKDCGVEFNPKSQHKCGYSKCVTCKKYLPNNHECFIQPHKFLDEIAYDNAGQDEDLIGKADALFKQRLQKSRYIVWDIETFALNQQSGKGRQVPHLLIAATTCYNCLNRPFKKQLCATCEGHHKTRECISNEAWKIDNTHVKVSCWADDIGLKCEECGQQQLIIRSGNTKALFKGFIHWLLRDKLNGFTLVAHNGAGFDNHYLFHYLIKENGLTVDPIYSGSKLLQFTVKKSANDRDYLIRGIDSAQFFLAQLKSLPKQFGLDTSDFKKGFFPYKFDKPEHWNYVGKFPDISYYAPNEMSSAEALEIKTWHQQQQDKVFNFRKEMVDYCLQDVRILLSAIQVAVQ